jgi:uncharacterized membrane protein
MTDQKLEIIIANLLRTGVTISAAVVLIGGIGYLLQHGGDQPAYRVFHAAPATYRSIPGIATAAARLDWLAVIQFGLLLLIATPVARVGFALVAFGLEKDRVYVVITTLVLAILLYSLIVSHP